MMINLRVTALAITAIAGLIWGINKKLNHHNSVKKLTDQLSQWAKEKPSDGRKQAKKRIIESLDSLTGNINGKLDLSYLDLDEIPDCMMLLPHIESIDCTGNQLTSLPSSIKTLHNLKTMILNNNPMLTTIPNCLMENSTIENLNIANCAIEQIPKKIQNMPNLKKILCHHNKLSNIASTIGHLQNLHTFSLHGNETLKKLPASMEKLERLKDLTADLELTERYEKLFKTTERRYKAYLEYHLPHKKTHAELIADIAQDNNNLQDFLKTQSTFMAFVFKLQSTKVWLNQKEDTIENIREIARKMQSDSNFCDECHIMANQSTESCSDRMIFYYILMNLSKKRPTLTLDSDFEDVFKSAKSTAMIMHTIDTARENAIESNQPDEEIEYCLAYLENIKQQLDLDVPQMAYRHHIKINQERINANISNLDNTSEHMAYELMRDDPSYRRINCIKTILSEISAQKKFDTTEIDAQHDSDYLEKISQLKHALEKKQLETLYEAKKFGYLKTLRSIQSEQQSTRKKGKAGSILKLIGFKTKAKRIIRFFRYLREYHKNKNAPRGKPSNNKSPSKNN